MTADLTTEDQDSVLRLGVEREKWGVLDRHSPWESFARRAAEAETVAVIKGFGADVALAVDWSGVGAFEATGLGAELQLVYLVYRIFSSNSAVSSFNSCSNLPSFSYRAVDSASSSSMF